MDIAYYMGGMLNYEDDLYFLIKYKEYDFDNSDITFSYDLEDVKLKELKNKYDLEKIARNKNSFISKLNLMLWVTKTLRANGACIPPHNCNSIDILDLTINNGLQSNCRMHAVVLTEILLSFGYKARMIKCLPMDLRFSECHCMCIVYCDFYEKWIAMDPSLGGIYYDENRIPMNIFEIREAMILNKHIEILYLPNNSKSVQQYLCKNFIRFQCHLVSRYNNDSKDSNNTFIYLNPKDYHISNKYCVDNNINNHIFISNPYVFWEL